MSTAGSPGEAGGAAQAQPWRGKGREFIRCVSGGWPASCSSHRADRDSQGTSGHPISWAAQASIVWVAASCAVPPVRAGCAGLQPQPFSQRAAQGMSSGEAPLSPAVPPTSVASSPGLTFVAELAGPAAVTDALPGLVAGPVQAPRHAHALLAVLALPAWIAPGGQGRAASRHAGYRHLVFTETQDGRAGGSSTAQQPGSGCQHPAALLQAAALL